MVRWVFCSRASIIGESQQMDDINLVGRQSAFVYSREAVVGRVKGAGGELKGGGKTIRRRGKGSIHISSDG